MLIGVSEQLRLFPTRTLPVVQGWVYVLDRPASFGTIYKIGTTARDPRERARELRSHLVAFVPGGPVMERHLHRRFARYRLPGTEWFLPGSELVDWVGHIVATMN